MKSWGFFYYMKENKTVIIVAGGSGQRMGNGIPKQFLALNGKPILMYSVEIFKAFDPGIKIILVLPASHIHLWNELCNNHQFQVNHTIVAGGETRYHSVKNGLQQVDNNGLIAIHDGVRPLVSIDTIRNAFDTARSFGSAVPVLEVNESVRELTEKGNQIIDRKKLRLIQTPQVFEASKIKKAYQQPYQGYFTDDASVFEITGESIYLTEGNWENIKITRPVDLKFAESVLASG